MNKLNMESFKYLITTLVEENLLDKNFQARVLAGEGDEICVIPTNGNDKINIDLKSLYEKYDMEEASVMDLAEQAATTVTESNVISQNGTNSDPNSEMLEIIKMAQKIMEEATKTEQSEPEEVESTEDEAHTEVPEKIMDIVNAVDSIFNEDKNKEAVLNNVTGHVAPSSEKTRLGENMYLELKHVIFVFDNVSETAVELSGLTDHEIFAAAMERIQKENPVKDIAMKIGLVTSNIEEILYKGYLEELSSKWSADLAIAVFNDCCFIAPLYNDAIKKSVEKLLEQKKDSAMVNEVVFYWKDSDTLTI